MNLDSIKAKFMTYLEKEGKIDANDLCFDNGDISIFRYANEFKNYLRTEYNVNQNDILSKSISDILEMEFTEDGKLVDPDEIEAYEEAIESGVIEDTDGNLETEEKIDDETGEETKDEEDGNSCKGKAAGDEIAAEVRVDLKNEISTKIAVNEDDIIDEFDNQITDTIEDKIDEGEIEESNIFNDIFNDLLQDKEFKDTIDTDKTGDISKEEFSQFINSIKGFDDNEDDVSVNDLLTAAVQIGNNEFNFISLQPPQTNEIETNNPERTPNDNIGKDTTTSTNTPTKVPEKDNITNSSDFTDANGTESDCSNITTGKTETNISIDNGASSGNLESMTGELESLQAEKADTESDLDTQTDTYNNAQSEKESSLGQFDSEIDAGKANLDGANKEVETTCAAKNSAQNDLDDAAKNLSCGQQTLEDKDCGLKQAQDDTCSAKAASETANVNNQDAIAAEDDAKKDCDGASDDLNTAVDNTGAAQAVANTAGAELTAATVSADEAFSVLNLRNQEVAQAQSEYNNAQAQANNASESLWQRFMNWVNDAWNFLSDAIAQRDHAEAEAEREAAKQKEAQIASDEALEELAQREEEQEDAKKVLDQANVVLDRATGEREVSDQEYAESLILLSDAMGNEEAAESEYNAAFDNYIQLNNYHIDAEGRLQDAKGNYISATQVAEEFTTYIQGLVNQRNTEETKYDEVIVTTAAVIAGDQEKISDLDSQINQLTKEIEEEERNIAIQESMITALANDQSQLNAAKGSAGLVDNAVALFGGGNTAEQNAINDKKVLLEQALLSGDSEAIQEAYKAIYGDEEVYLDANGNVVNIDEISEEERQNLTTGKVSELSAENLNAYINNDAETKINAANTVSAINEGSIIYNGQEISMVDLNEILLAQVDSTETDMNNAVERQGIISKIGGFINNGLGIGTSEVEARAQVDSYQQLAADLNNCTDPIEYAALFKEITGQDFDLETVCGLLAYSEVKSNQETTTRGTFSGRGGGFTGRRDSGNSTTSETGASTGSIASSEQKNSTTSNTGKIDITTSVSGLSNTIINDYDGDADLLSFTMDSKAQESIQDYKETQTAVKDGIIGVATGVISTAVVTFCTAAGICAAPFTAGASLGMIAAGFAIAGATGAAVSTGLNAVDSIYDSDGDGTAEFNYSWKEAGIDASIGALNGAVGVLSNGVGSAVAGKISTQATQTAISTTFRESARNATINLSGKMAGAAVEGFIDGSVSASGEYAITALLDENVDFSFEQFAESGLQGGLMGSAFNVGLTGLTSGISSIHTLSDANKFSSDINSILSGNASNNELAEIVARQLDDSLLDADGMINRYAAGQLMRNAESSLGTLQKYYKKMGLDPNDAMSALENIPLTEMQHTSAILDALSKSGLSDIDMTTAEGISEGLKKIDSIEVNQNGTVSSIKLTSNGEQISLDFDNNGRFTGTTTIKDGDDGTGITDGDDGAKIADGDDGAKITDGDDGAKIADGDDGAKIADGDDGAKIADGDDGAKIADGDDGAKIADGDDGSEIEQPISEELKNQRYEELVNKGMPEDLANIITNKDLTNEQYNRLKTGLEDGMDPIDAYSLISVNDEIYQKVLELNKLDISVSEARFAAGILDESQYQELISCIKNGNEFSHLYSDNGFIIEMKLTSSGEIKTTSMSLSDIEKINSLSIVNNLDDRFNIINYAKHGERLDLSLENYTIKIGDQEIKIFTDNNIVSQEYAMTHGINLDEIRILTRNQEQLIQDALQTMKASGQQLPEKIYLTDIFETFMNDGHECIAAGVYCYANRNTIFLNAALENSDDYFKDIIYHESAHMTDFEIGSGYNLLSEEKGIIINYNTNVINFGDININASDVERMISRYSLTNPAEYVAEITAMITDGTIVLDSKGNYRINTDILGRYQNAKGIASNFLAFRDGKTLNNIMALYNYLTEGKIARARMV